MLLTLIVVFLFMVSLSSATSIQGSYNVSFPGTISTTAKSADILSGIEIIPSRDIVLNNINTTGTDTAAFIFLSSDGTLIENTSIVNNKATFNGTTILRFGTSYKLVTNGSTNAGITASTSPPYAINYSDLVVNCTFNAGGTKERGVSNLYELAKLNYSIYELESFSSESYNITSYETAGEDFILNVTNLTTNNPTSATLNYGGVTYTGTITASGNSNFILNKKIDIPLVPSTNTWFWSIVYGGVQYNTSNRIQNVRTFNFSICDGAPYDIPFLNFTFKNETLGNAVVNASIISTWTSWLGSGLVNKSYSYTSTTANPSYAFCSNPGTRPSSTIPSIQYYNAESPIRTYAPGTLSLTNSTTNTILYLLPTSTGIYVTFQIINAALQPVSGAEVSVVSSLGDIQAGITDSSGGVTFFLNPTTSYTITASKTGLTSATTTVTPAQSSYTLTLGSTSSAVTVFDTTRGITLSTAPLINYLDNQTIYNFNLTLTSDYYTVSSFGFTLRNATGVLGTASSSSNGGTVSLSMSTGNNSLIRMDYFWVITGNYTNATREWIVFDNSGTGWSINNFVTDLKTYLNSGLFGLDSFGLNIIVFLVILIATGVSCYSFGFTSPGAVMGILFTWTVLFDAGLGLITYAPPLPSHAATFITGIAALAFIIREAYT